MIEMRTAYTISVGFPKGRELLSEAVSVTLSSASGYRPVAGFREYGSEFFRFISD
jgi:hypothetical protein